MLARYAPAGNKTLLTDALNSVIAQASDTQAIENYYAYSPYGEAQTLGPDGGNPLQYTGRENDGTGLMYYRARYYDPVLKRFVSEDPIGITGGLNLTAYVAGDPVSLTDPTGNITSSWNLIPYLPPAVQAQLVLTIQFVAPPVANMLVQTTVAHYQYTIAINVARTAVAAVSAYTVVGTTAFYGGYLIGTQINKALTAWYWGAGNTQNQCR